MKIQYRYPLNNQIFVITNLYMERHKGKKQVSGNTLEIPLDH